MGGQGLTEETCKATKTGTYFVPYYWNASPAQVDQDWNTPSRMIMILTEGDGLNYGSILLLWEISLALGPSRPRD